MTERQLKRIINEEINNILGNNIQEMGKLADIKARKLSGENGRDDEAAKKIFDKGVAKLLSDFKIVIPAYEAFMLSLIDAGFTNEDFTGSNPDLSDINDEVSVGFDAELITKKGGDTSWPKFYTNRQRIMVKQYSNSPDLYLSCFDNWGDCFNQTEIPAKWDWKEKYVTILTWDWSRNRANIVDASYFDYHRQFVQWYDFDSDYNVREDLETFFKTVSKIIPKITSSLDAAADELNG